MNRNGYSRMADSEGYEEFTEDAGKKKKAKSHRGAASSEKSNLIKGAKSKTVYVFNDGRMAEAVDQQMELESMTQRAHSGKSRSSYKSTTSTNPLDNVSTSEIPLEPTDTLHNLAIRFRCSVAELKRINGLYTDNEFYGLASIKVPVRPHQHHLIDELEKMAKDRKVNHSAKTKATSPADLVSSETSEDEGAYAHPRQANSASLVDMVDVHSDPEEGDSYALLDRQWSRQKPPRGNKDKAKFEKMIGRKDDEIKRITEKVHEQAANIESVTSAIPDNNSVSVQRSENCLNNMMPTVRCVIISCVVIFIVAPALVALMYGVDKIRDWHKS